MAELLEDTKVTMGEVIHVKNVEEGKTESTTYQAIQLEDETGKHEFCILLTAGEYKKIPTTALPDALIKEFKPGRVYTVQRGSIETNWIRLKDEGFTFLAQVSNNLLKRATNRANKHPESVTKKSFLTDLLD